MKKLLGILICVALFQCSFAQTKLFSVKITGKGQAVLFLPGYSCSGDNWDETVRELSSYYQCYVFTLAGFASQPPTDSPSLQLFATAISNYIQSNHLQKPVLIGHSLGGVLSLMIAAQHAGLISKAVIVDALPFFSSMQHPSWTADSVKVSASQMANYYQSLSDDQLRSQQISFAKYLCGDSTHVPLIVQWGMQSDRRTLGIMYADFLKTDLRNEIGKITCPTLILAAQSGFPPSAVSQLYGMQYANLKTKQIVVAQNSRHFIMYDQPKWFYEQLENFLKQ